MNVLVWSSYVAQPVGGQERTSLEIALQLYQRGHHVILVGAYDNAPELRAKIPAAMPYYFFDMHRRRIKPHLAVARLLQRLMKRHQIQVVSAHGSVFALHEICRWRGIPMVWTIHGAQPRSPGILNRLKTALVRHVVTWPGTHIVGVSRATAEIIHGQFPKMENSQVHYIITGGMNDDALATLPPPQPGPPWHLGFIGRIVRQKRPLDLVEVAQGLEGHLDYRMHVFGDGPLLGELRDAIEQSGIAEKFIVHGYWDRGTPGMIEQLQILIHPSEEEPLGLSLIEAQLGARPVVAYKVGGIPEILEEGVTGLMVPVGDVPGLIAAIRSVSGQVFTSYSQAARKRATKQFTMKQMIDQYEALLERLSVSH
jgi:glycosyltransferase involved in cell wall biosynthesis